MLAHLIDQIQTARAERRALSIVGRETKAFYGGVRNVNPNPDNRDPVLNNVNLPPQQGGQVADFVANGLLDPRVRLS